MPLSSRPLGLQPNLLHTHSHVNKAALGNGQGQVVGDEENVQPAAQGMSARSTASALTLVKAGSAVVANGSGHAGLLDKVVVYNDTNKENAPVARSTRSRMAATSCLLGQGAAMSSVSGVVPSCQPTATAAGLANTLLHQKPRRVLQEIKV
jgi:hypothetical protein